MQNLNEKLPYVLINYIYTLRSLLLIQRTFRKNRPNELLMSKCLTISDDGDAIEYMKYRGYTDFYTGDRVLIIQNGVHRYGTINNVFPPLQGFTYIVRPVKNVTESLYLYPDTGVKLILLSGWKDQEYKRDQMLHLWWTTPSF